MPGNPDIIFRRRRAVIFVDGDFWHGRRWPARRARLLQGSNADYWIAKIEGNRKRDQLRSRELRRLGWLVIRVWESDVRRDARAVAKAILDQMERDLKE